VWFEVVRCIVAADGSEGFAWPEAAVGECFDEVGGQGAEADGRYRDACRSLEGMAMRPANASGRDRFELEEVGADLLDDRGRLRLTDEPRPFLQFLGFSSGSIKRSVSYGRQRLMHGAGQKERRSLPSPTHSIAPARSRFLPS
jgi:hypothetical protein